jgi:uncharacterized circularly permuted ATP-grasp superfamily protein
MLASVNPSETPPSGRLSYHEFYCDDFEPREHYRPLWEHIRKAGQSSLADKAAQSHLAMRTEGVTFTVSGPHPLDTLVGVAVRAVTRGSTGPQR